MLARLPCTSDGKLDNVAVFALSKIKVNYVPIGPDMGTISPCEPISLKPFETSLSVGICALLTLPKPRMHGMNTKDFINKQGTEEDRSDERYRGHLVNEVILYLDLHEMLL